MISMGFIISLIFFVIISLVMLVITLVCALNDDKDIAIGVTAVWWFFVLPIALFGFFPYDMQYHSYRPVDGKVVKMDKRLMGGSDNLAEKYAVQLEGSPQIYGCEDTRCSVLKPGDTLSLMCIREWEYAGVDGYNCKYNQ